MKTTYKALTLFCCIALGCQTITRAQGDLSELIKSGPGDATKLAAAYLNPLFKGFGVGLNSGWTNTARAKNFGHFDIRLSATGAFVPKKDKAFDVTRLGLSNKVRLAPGSTATAQTAFGKNSGDGPVLQTLDNNGNVIESFELPGGVDLPFVPAPQLQITAGLPKNIDITVRAFPKRNLGDDIGEVSMIGGGIKFEVLPLLSKTADRILPFNLAVAFGFTQFKYTFDLDVPPPSAPKDPSQVKDFTTQIVDAKFSGFTTEAIISKKLAIFTPFFSVGYNTSKTNVGLKGNYPLITDALIVGTTVTPLYTTFTDPITIKKRDINGLRSSIGFQLDLAIFKVYGSYTAAEYSSLNAGIGLGL